MIYEITIDKRRHDAGLKCRVGKIKDCRAWYVSSENSTTIHKVTWIDSKKDLICDCEDFKYRKKCKHCIAVVLQCFKNPKITVEG